VEKEGAMATETISLKPIVDLVKKKKKKLAGARKFVSVAGRKAIDSRIKILDKVEVLVTSACAASGSSSAKGTGGSTIAIGPPLSVVVPKGR
jgi:hypothetical protein